MQGTLTLVGLHITGSTHNMGYLIPLSLQLFGLLLEPVLLLLYSQHLQGHPV